MRDSLTVEVVKTRQENPEVLTLYFSRPFGFIPGQYITVFIDGSRVREGKAYSISSLPEQDLMSITVKDVGGEFSKYLCSRQVGDKLQISSCAYGNFNPQTDRPLVGITAGCALGPIWSVMADASQQKSLYFSHRSPELTVFRQELADSDISVNHFSTRSKVKEKDDWHNGRLSVENIIRESPKNAHFLLCGSVSFVSDVWRKLVSGGVDERRISTETFFEK